MKKNSFVFGAAVLMVANITSKALGAIFKIPLAYILGEYGMAVFNTAFSVYVMVLSLVSAGFPVAVSRGVSVRCGAGRSSAGFIKSALSLLLFSGAVGSIVMLTGARFFSYAMREPDAVVCIRVLAPSVFFVAWGTVYKCFYQGRANMIPTAVSQVVEAFIRLGAGIYFALLFARRGAAAAAAGALAGITVGELAASAILRALYRREPADTRTRRADILEISAIAVPLMFASLATNMISLADITMLRTRLCAGVFDAHAAARLCDSYRHAFELINGRLTAKDVSWLYGSYSGFASVIFNLPCGIIATIGISLFPLTARASENDPARLCTLTDRGCELASAAAVPCAVVLFFFSAPVLSVIFRNSVSAPLLSMLSLSLFPMCTANMLINILYSAGCIHRPFFYSLAAYAAKLAVLWTLAADAHFNIFAAPLSLFAYSVIVLVLNIIGIKKKFGFFISPIRVFARPLFCGAVMTFICILLKSSALVLLPQPAYLCLSATVSVLAYLSVFLLTGGRLFQTGAVTGSSA